MEFLAASPNPIYEWQGTLIELKYLAFMGFGWDTFISFVCGKPTCSLVYGIVVLSSLTHREFMQLSDHNNVELQYFSMEPLPLVFVRGEILRVWGGTRTLRRVLGAPVVALLEGSLRSADRASDRAAVVVAPPQIRMTFLCILLGNA